MRQLCALLEAQTCVEVAVARDDSMRTAAGGFATEGSADCKNAVIIGQRVHAEDALAPSCGDTAIT